MIPCSLPADAQRAGRPCGKFLGEAYNLLEAGNARQAMLLEQNRSCIAAVVLDITTAAAKREATILREHLREFLDEIPIIVITDSDNAGTLDHCFAMGVSDVISLDYDPYAMVRRIDNQVQLHIHKDNLQEMVKEQDRADRDALTKLQEQR